MSTRSRPFALRIATIAWAALTLIHLTIWTLSCVISGGFNSPWWLWISAPPAVVIGALWWLLRE
jgi:hypothetical protein